MATRTAMPIKGDEGSGSLWLGGHPFHKPKGWVGGLSDAAVLRANAASEVCVE